MPRVHRRSAGVKRKFGTASTCDRIHGLWPRPVVPIGSGRSRSSIREDRPRAGRVPWTMMSSPRRCGRLV